MLHELGNRLAQGQAIPAAGDIYWLTEEEVRRMAARLDDRLLVEAAAETITLRKREHRAALRATPPGKGNVIKGVAASPGKVTGTARVLHGPEDFSQMQPGDVLVAPITTPAWTPLFAMASAVVTDVGGPLSHGSIVAREYGIPSVLGTGVATRRIQDGQEITVDGGAGTVILHTER
jgi:phosphoenolpyruvate synthase/pyruvate phosphate dikinase